MHVSGVERSVCHVFDNTRILIENNIKKLIYWFWVNVNKAKTSKKKKKKVIIIAATEIMKV